jgi:hypothetical protein
VKLWLSGESVRYIRDEETAHCRKFHFLTGRLIMYPPPPHRKGSTWLLFCFADECKTWYCESSYSPRATYCQPHLHRALIGVTSFDRQTVRVSSFRLPGNRTGAEPCRRETLPSNVFVKSPWLDSAGGCSALGVYAYLRAVGVWLSTVTLATLTGTFHGFPLSTWVKLRSFHSTPYPTVRVSTLCSFALLETAGKSTTSKKKLPCKVCVCSVCDRFV